MSKKSIWQLVRKFWKINPRTRIKKSKKLYNRKKEKQELRRKLKEE